MAKYIRVYSSFSVRDLKRAKEFYGQTLGFEVNERPEGLDLVAEGVRIFIYLSPKNKPADFTVLNLVVQDTEQAVDELSGKGVVMEHYELPGLKTDEKGIVRRDADHAMAWFKDPDGNIIALSQKSRVGS